MVWGCMFWGCFMKRFMSTVWVFCRYDCQKQNSRAKARAGLSGGPRGKGRNRLRPWPDLRPGPESDPGLRLGGRALGAAPERSWRGVETLCFAF